MKRTFIAIKIDLAEEYGKMLQELQRHTTFDDIVWVKDSLHHLTLRFIGKTPEEKIPQITKSVREITANMPVFTLKINKLGVFGSRYCPKVIWLGFEKNEILDNLFQQIEKKLVEELGFEPVEGNWVPHLTLGRIKKIDDKKRFWQLIDRMQPTYQQEIEVHEITFFRSQLEKEGPIYTEISENGLNRLNG